MNKENLVNKGKDDNMEENLVNKGKDDTMEKLVFGLCAGRHAMPVNEYLFPHTIEDPFDFLALESVVHEKLKDADVVDLYVSGLTPVLMVVVNYCTYNGITLNLYHYNIATGDYVLQEVAHTSVWVYKRLDDYVGL